MEKVLLLSVCDAYQPQTITRKQFVNDGKYSVYGANGIIGHYNAYNHEEAEVLLGCRGNCGAVNMSEPYSWINGNAMVIKPNDTSVLDKRYLMYFLLSADKSKIISGTAQAQITRQNLKNLTIPICSRQDQERLVSLIEESFSEIDAGVETLERVKRQLTAYRHAVLKEAFSSVTEKRMIREMSSLVTSGSRGWAQFYADNGARFIRITDLTRDGIRLKNDHVQYVALPDKAEGKRSRLLSADVLVSITADLGSIALIPKDIEEAYINQHIAMIRFNNPAQGEYMAWYLRSEWGQKDLLKNKRGGGKLGLGLDDIRDTPIPLVSDEVAAKTVSFIDNRLSICENIEFAVVDVLQRAEAMRQSILRNAFEGRL